MSTNYTPFVNFTSCSIQCRFVLNYYQVSRFIRKTPFHYIADMAFEYNLTQTNTILTSNIFEIFPL